MKKYQYSNWITLGLILLAGGIVGITRLASANPSFFPTSARTSNATTSPVFLSFGGEKNGVGTSTTPTYDSYQITQGSNVGQNPTAPVKATALIQFTGSSSVSTLNVTQELSQDGVDWYPRTFASTTSQAPWDLSVTHTWQLKFASSTEGGVAGGNDIMKRSIILDVPTRYTRLVFTLSSSTLPNIRGGAIWSEIVPVKEIK